MFLKVILDRSDFFGDFVALGKNAASSQHSSTFYLLLPVKQNKCDSTMNINWEIVRRCLSSPIFKHPIASCERDPHPISNSLELRNCRFSESDVLNSLVFTPHNKFFYFVDGILHETNAHCQHKPGTSYLEHYMET